MGLIGLCYAQLATQYPRAGGEISYAYHMWGIDIAFLAGWLLVLLYVAAIAFQAVVIGWMIDAIAPELRGPILYEALGEPVYATPTAAGIALGLFVAVLNCRGVREAASFQSVLTFAKIAISLAFFVGAFLAADLDNLSPGWAPTVGEFSWSGIFAVCLTAPFFLAGFDVVPLAMGERSATTSDRAVYVAVVGSITAATLYYVLVIFSAATVLPRDQLLAAELPALAAFEQAFGSAIMVKLVVISAVMGMFTVWNASVYAGARVLFALGDSRLVPGWFSRLSKTRGVPVRAVVFLTIAGLALLPFGRAIIMPIVNTSSLSFIIVAIVVTIGLIRLHFRKQVTTKVPGGIVTLILASISAIALLVIALRDLWTYSDGSFPVELLILGLWSGVGIILWALTRRSRLQISEAERRERLLGRLNRDAPGRSRHGTIESGKRSIGTIAVVDPSLRRGRLCRMPAKPCRCASGRSCARRVPPLVRCPGTSVRCHYFALANDHRRQRRLKIRAGEARVDARFEHQVVWPRWSVTGRVTRLSLGQCQFSLAAV